MFSKPGFSKNSKDPISTSDEAESSEDHELSDLLEELSIFEQRQAAEAVVDAIALGDWSRGSKPLSQSEREKRVQRIIERPEDTAKLFKLNLALLFSKL